jgi:hypothetical protein
VVLVASVLLLLGHVCELPAFADRHEHAADSTSHGSDHHTGVAEASCDAVVGVRSASSGAPTLGAARHAAPISVVDVGPVPAVAVFPPPASAVRPAPFPLFLLHASLLI